MPSSKEDRFRQAWKAEDLSGKPAQAWLIVRRLAATLIAIGLIGYCGWLLFSLFWVPKTYVAYWSANAYQPLSAGPVKYACQDFAAIEALQGSFSGSTLESPAESPLSKERLEDELQKLSNLGMRHKDTCIMFLTAHGGIRDKEPCLLCEPGDRDSELPISEVLAALKNVSAGTKLLILDAGRDDFAPQAGTSIDNTFPALLEKAVKESGDPDLWILTANASLERSHVSPSLERSVFGYMVSQGLSGEAAHHHDRVVRLDELYNFVQGAVSAWVKMATASHESQTPQLLHSDPAKLAAAELEGRKLISAQKRVETPAHPPRHVAETGSESEGEPGGIRGWFKERGKEVKEKFTPTEEIEIFQHALGMHGHEGGEHEAHDAHSEGGAAEHAAHPSGEHEQTAGHETDGKKNSEGKAETAETALRRVSNSWKRAAELEAAPDQLSPGVVAPPIWRTLLDRLLWCDQFCAAGIPAEAKPLWKQVSKELTGIEQSLDEFDARPLPPPIDLSTNQPVSLALAARIAEIDPEKPLSKEMSDFLAKYVKLVLKEPPDTFKDKLNGIFTDPKSNPGLANLYEFQLLDLRKDPDVPSNLLQLVCARLTGEQVAMSPLCGEGWSRTEIEAGDRLRGEGERQLLDRTSDSWQELATRRLREALSSYNAAIRNLAVVRTATQLRNHMMLHAPDLIYRARLDGGDRQEIAGVLNVFASLEAITKALADPRANDTDTLRRLSDQLQTAKTALERPTDADNNASRVANDLATTLRPPDKPIKRVADLAAAEQKQMSSFKLPDTLPEAVQLSVPNDEQWKRATDDMKLRIALARLAGYDKKTIGQIETFVNGASKQPAKLYEARSQLADLFEKLPDAIVYAADSGKSNPSDELTRLHNAMPAWLLLGPQHLERKEFKNDLISKLDSASWRDLLDWNYNRFRRAADDAPLVEKQFLDSVSAAFRSLANRFPGASPNSSSDQHSLSIDSPTEISLVSADETTLKFSVTSNVEEKQPIWLIAQYNDKWLNVGKEEDEEVRHQQDLQARVAGMSSGERAAHYPLRPDAFRLSSTDTLPARGTRSYSIKIKRQPNVDAGGAAKLILKAVAGETFVRRELIVNLPGRELLEVRVNAAPEFWTAKSHSLHPLPNREQNFALEVVNHAKVAKKLDVSIYAPGKLPKNTNYASIPLGAQKAETAKEVLSEFEPLEPLGPAVPIELKATGEPVPIKLPATEFKIKSSGNSQPPEKADSPAPSGIPLRYGLIISLVDQQTKEVTIRRIEMSPQRPQGYLDAVTHFDPKKDLLQINVTAKNRDIIPPDGMKITADVTGVSAQLSRSLEAELKSPTYSASLYAHLLPSESNVVARVNVDDYPRAFVFKFTRGTAPQDLTPAHDLEEVRIISPQPGDKFKAPANLPVTAEVDAPEGTFGDTDTTSTVEIGIDENQDRDLQEQVEPVEIRRSDRQVNVTAKKILDDGSLVLDTRVSDFHVAVFSGQQDRKANVLGRLTINGKPTRSQPVEILLDGSPPIVHAAMPPNREVETGDDLVIKVLTRPEEADLSGVRRVEAVFDSLATKDAKPAKWEVGLPEGPNSWIVKLSTKDIALPAAGGVEKTVLVRATDEVGNISEPLKDTVTIIPKRIKPVPPVPNPVTLPNELKGLVQFGDGPVAAKVWLETPAGTHAADIDDVKSDATGRFSFPKVPPGTYTVKAVTLNAINNWPRKGEKSAVKVLAKPQPATEVTLTVR